MEAPPKFSMASSPAFVPKKFSIPLSYKLTNENFLLWQQEALATIKGHFLQYHLRKENIPKMYLTDEDAIASNQNPEFCDWEQQDNILLAWLLAFSSENIRVRMVGCIFAYKSRKEPRNFLLLRHEPKFINWRLNWRALRRLLPWIYIC